MNKQKQILLQQIMELDKEVWSLAINKQSNEYQIKRSLLDKKLEELNRLETL